jgi:hypothetical protein
LIVAWRGNSLQSLTLNRIQQSDCLTVEDGTDKLSQNVPNKLPIYGA